ncbi:Trans-1,2-dihydrobenzene-1,2-diol dehydrogenase [Hypsibius exemplaris]|uniref:Trans-1,2-dihydrobenzene-1,2-diol dehydrogenase n=1 Tax=Hypsibius exemplaris TaxID=2072580 RepID=A0A1W0WMJ2_HYPEX|nr:Trans-1,2-dihydrobenzene-1,2-diol dehydrogenase [Hypsibius exemplaris]
MAPLRWGIVGTGKISQDFANAVETLPPADHELYAVAASDAKKAAEFAKTYTIPKSYGSYAELAKDPEVGVAYIGTINTNHFELCKLFLENGKHVLCEKPLTLLLEHTQELVKLAREKKLFFQEAVWSRFFPAYIKLREEVKAGTLGDLKLITVNFGVKIAEVERIFKKELGGGSLMDIGIYVLQFTVAVFGSEMPQTIKAVGVLNEEGCDLATGITLQYKDGRIAQLTTNTFTETTCDANVFGTKGSIKVPKPFWAPEEIILNGESLKFPLPGKAKRPFVYGNSEGLAYEAAEVKRCIDNGLLESPLMTQEETITLARLEDEVKKQIGVSYDELYKKK